LIALEHPSPPQNIKNTSELYRDGIDSGEQFYSFLFIYRRHSGVVSRHGKKIKFFFWWRRSKNVRGHSHTLTTNGNNAYIKYDMPTL
jgi:hypothetical protein